MIQKVFVVLLLLVAAVLSTVEARENWGLFGCPTVKPNKNTNITDTGIDAYKTKFLSYFPLSLYAAAEKNVGRPFSCMTWTLVGEKPSLTYYQVGSDGQQGPVAASSNPVYKHDEISFEFKLPKKGLLGANKNNHKLKFYLDGDSGDFVTFRSCNTGFLTHFTRTYSFLKSGVDHSIYDWRCIIEKLDRQYGIGAEPKGICFIT